MIKKIITDIKVLALICKLADLFKDYGYHTVYRQNKESLQNMISFLHPIAELYIIRYVHNENRISLSASSDLEYSLGYSFIKGKNVLLQLYKKDLIDYYGFISTASPKDIEYYLMNGVVDYNLIKKADNVTYDTVETVFYKMLEKNQFDYHGNYFYITELLQKTNFDYTKEIDLLSKIEMAKKYTVNIRVEIKTRIINYVLNNNLNLHSIEKLIIKDTSMRPYQALCQQVRKHFQISQIYNNKTEQIEHTITKNQANFKQVHNAVLKIRERIKYKFPKLTTYLTGVINVSN